MGGGVTRVGEARNEALPSLHPHTRQARAGPHTSSSDWQGGWAVHSKQILLLLRNSLARQTHLTLLVLR